MAGPTPQAEATSVDATPRRLAPSPLVVQRAVRIQPALSRLRLTPSLLRLAPLIGGPEVGSYLPRVSPQRSSLGAAAAERDRPVASILIGRSRIGETRRDVAASIGRSRLVLPHKAARTASSLLSLSLSERATRRDGPVGAVRAYRVQDALNEPQFEAAHPVVGVVQTEGPV